MTDYKYINMIDDDVDQMTIDLKAIQDHAQRAEDWWSSMLLQQLTTCQPLALMTVSMLSGLKVMTPEVVHATGANTLAVGTDEIFLNGVFLCHERGAVRGDTQIGHTLILHEGVHKMYMHPTRMTRHLMSLQERGIIHSTHALQNAVMADIKHHQGAVAELMKSNKLTEQQTVKLWNGIIDLVDDSVGIKAARESSMYKPELLTEHLDYVADLVRTAVDDMCEGLDSNWFVQQAIQSQQTVEQLVELFIAHLAQPEEEEQEEEENQPPPPGGGGNCPGDGDDEGDGDGDSEETEEEPDGGEDGDPEEESDDDSDGGAGDGSDTGDAPTGAGGSGVGDGNNGNAGDGDGDPASPLDDIPIHVEPLDERTEAAVQQKEVEQAAQIIAAGKQAGNGSALQQLILAAEDILKPPVVTWQEQFEAVMSSLSEEMSYQRQYEPSLAMGDIVLPDYDKGFGALAIAFDTSGSVWHDPDLRDALLSEMCHLVADLDYEKIYLLPTDTQVIDCIEVAPGDEFPLGGIRGGGGTAFDPPFEYLDKHGIDVDALVYCTDGEGHVHVSEPAYEVIWLLGVHSTDRYIDGTFGRIINMETYK